MTTKNEAWELLVDELRCFADTCADGGVDSEDENDLSMVSMLGAIEDYADKCITLALEGKDPCLTNNS